MLIQLTINVYILQSIYLLQLLGIEYITIKKTIMYNIIVFWFTNPTNLVLNIEKYNFPNSI